jgi:glycosyltransferase involved in cell wall biosynthesis
VTIALDATPLTLSSGGGARYTSQLARALAEDYPDDQYWLLSDQEFAMPQHWAANLLWGLDRAMSRRAVQLFHGTDFSVPYLPRRPSVMTLHDLSPWLYPTWQPEADRVRRRTPRLLRLGLATMVITPTQAIRRAAIERFRLPSDRVAAVPLAAGEEFRPVPGPPPERPYFLFVGTLEPRKNIARLVEAWREVRRNIAVDLVLAGRARPGFHVPSEEPGLRVLGETPDRDLPALYSGALACVYPSFYEGFGLPVLEAMRCGTVAIASRDAAIREVAGGAAIHVEAGDTRGLVQAMEAVARAPENFAALRHSALDRAAQFSWRTTAQQTREVYDAAARFFRKK